MSQVCNRCYRIVDRACQSDTEMQDCVELKRRDPKVPPPKPSVPTTCIEHAYGTTTRLSFQIKVF